MPADPTLPFAVVPVSDEKVYVIESQRRGGWVEVTLARANRQRRRFAADRYETTELLAIQRFRRADMASYMTFASHLEDTARVAVRGDLGYRLHTTAQDGTVTLSLVARLLEPDGRVHTEISHEQQFTDADSQTALVQANERATELTAMAEDLTEQWIAALDARVSEVRAANERLDAEHAAAEGLRSIIDGARD